MFYRNRLPSRRSAFSLMEMLVVIAIIGLLVGTIAVSVRGHLARSRITVAKAEIAKIVDSLESYSGFNARYPTQEEGLRALTGEGKDGIENEYLEPGALNDPWGTPYEFITPGSSGEPFEIICSGPDRQFETEDDISSLTLRDE